MSKNEEYCLFCGSAIESGSQFCHNCGAALSDVEKTQPVQPVQTTPSASSDYYQQPLAQQGPYHQQPTTVYVPRKRDDSQGTIALIFGILACVGILPCIGGIIAISVGNNAKGSSTGSIAVTLGWISICLNIIYGIIVLIISFMFW